MEIKKGDLLKSDVPAIIHQCNCFHTMGGGIAFQLAMQYPDVYKADKETGYGDKDKMGHFSFAEIRSEHLKYVINLYSQYDFGFGLHTDYDALEKGLNEAMVFLKKHGVNRVGLPYLIGCGLAGGNEKTVLEILERVQSNHSSINIELYKLGD